MTIYREKPESSSDREELEKRKYEFSQEIGICTRSQHMEQNESISADVKALSGEENSSRIEKMLKGK